MKALSNARMALAGTLCVLDHHIRGTRVTHIRCEQCRRWVRPRRYDCRYGVCGRCLPAAKAHHRAQIRATERRLGLT